MTNLIGDEINSYTDWLGVPGATVHLYGKGGPRPGRKMGHVTQVIPVAGPRKPPERDLRGRVLAPLARGFVLAPVDIRTFV